MVNKNEAYGTSIDQEESITFFLAGDVMTGRGIDQILPHSADPGLHEQFVKDARQYVRLAAEKNGPIPESVGYGYVWGEALKILDQINPDLRIINLETSLTTHNRHLKGKGIHYRMHPDNVNLLTAAGIDIGTLANNHVLDWREKGLNDTLSTLHHAEIQTAGAGLNREDARKPAVHRNPVNRVLVFAYGVPTAGILPSWQADEQKPGINVIEKLNRKNRDRIVSDIELYRQNGDIIVLSLHWGGNWGYEVSKQERRFARALVDSNAVDMLFGHSSHHPRGIEIYNEHPIFYGCGDLINDYEGISGRKKYRGQLRLMYFPRLNADGTLSSLTLQPVTMKRFQLIRSTEEDTQWLMETVKRESRKLDTELGPYLT